VDEAGVGNAQFALRTLAQELDAPYVVARDRSIAASEVLEFMLQFSR
jgi:hypothetical protein